MARLDQHSDVIVYASGLCYASVCAPITLTSLEVAERANLLHPAGTTNGWHPSEDVAFASGAPNPCKCEQDPEARRHWLLEC